MTVNNELEKIESLRSDFEYIDGETDGVVMTVGFVGSFYYWGGHTAAKRLALVECFEAYEAAYGSHLKWGWNPDSWRPVNLTKKPFPTLREYIKPLDEDDTIMWYLSSAHDPEEVGNYVASCLTERGWEEDEPSCFHFQLPLEHAFDTEKLRVLESFLTLCAEKLIPFHGVAGLAAMTVEQGPRWEPEALDLATRYRALYIEDIVADLPRAPDGLKGVNWLTFVGDLLTERLGGPEAFAAYCQRFNIQPERYANGFMIRAGATPQLGPVDEPPPEAYVRANAAIRPLRNGKYGSMGSGSIDGELRFNRCTSDLWIRRFDGPGIWPPASFAGLPRGPVGTKPAKKVRIETGKPCVVHGRYRKYPLEPAQPGDGADDIRGPMVVLLPGDLAPFHVTLGPHGEFVSREVTTWELVAEL
ncbi:type VI immunity family protein [Massilia luteola]|uniref:type VI immunity family protein n=1 Tax=Massilia luteola TaxID=3081751 RepID=UPI002ACC30FA|nr:type VI immunity family protein [Massilia sp. Gc5]